MHRKVTLPFVRFTAQARAMNWNGEIAGVASDTSGESGTVMWKPIARRRCWRLFDLQCFGVGQPRAHKRGRMLSETVTMRAVCLALALGWVLACSDLAAPPLLLDLDGRYVGSWQVIARDTAEVCSISGVCGQYPPLARVECEVTLDVYRTGQWSFTGNFGIPNTGTECHRTGFEPILLDSVRVPNQFLAEVDDFLQYEPGPGTWRLRIEVGSSRRVDLERLVGCTLLDARSDWLMVGGLFQQPDPFPDGERLLTTITGHVIYREQFEQGDRGGARQAALCGDRRVDLAIGFRVGRRI